MYELSVEDEFSAAHRLRNYEGNCERLHGHNWRVCVTVQSNELDDRGLVVDFKQLKAMLRRVLDGLEHQYLNELPPFDAINPTCEHLASFIFKSVNQQILSDQVRIKSVRIWESAKSSCTYRGETHDNG